MEHYRHTGVSLISAELRTVPTLGKTGVVGIANYTKCVNINTEKIGMCAVSLHTNLYEEIFSGPPRTGSSRPGLPAGSAPSPYLPSNVPSFQRWRQCLSVESETLLLFCFFRLSTTQRYRIFCDILSDGHLGPLF